MVFPKSILILGRRFEIIFKEEVILDGKVVGATVDFHSMQIHVDPTMTDVNQWKSFFHEVVHIGLDVSGIDQTLSSFAVEVICQTLANTFYDLVMSFNDKKNFKK